jgi:hypothetical protein
MLPLTPSFVTCMNVLGEVSIAHRSLSSSSISSRGQTPKFNTTGSVQGVEAKLDEHRRATTMFQQGTKYSVQMTNILLRLSILEFKNK